MMYQEFTPLYEDHYTDIYSFSTEQSSFESEESGPTQSLYSYDPSYSETFIGDNLSYEDDILISQEDVSTQENVIRESFTEQKVLPEIVNSSEMQWITSTSTDVKIHTPVSSSSNLLAVPGFDSQSDPLQMKNQIESLEKSSSMTEPGENQTTIETVSAGVKPTSSSKLIKSIILNSLPVKKKGTPGRKRKYQDHELSPAEAARRHVRRERNKLAAAKCRNRRRELTDRLQGETDHLEDHQQMLQREIIALEREKKNLEYILASHSPNCKAGMNSDLKIFHQQYTDLVRQETAIDLSNVSSYHPADNMIMTENSDSALPYLKHHHDEMQLSDSFSSPLSSMPVSIPHPFHFRHQNVGYNSAFERQRHNLRRQQAVDFTNAMTLEPNNNLSHANQQQVQNYEENLPSKLGNFGTFHSLEENQRLKSSLSFQNSSTASDSSCNSIASIPSFAAPFSSTPLNLIGRQAQQVCSFDHLQHSQASSRQPSSSMKSPKHLLAL